MRRVAGCAHDPGGDLVAGQLDAELHVQPDDSDGGDGGEPGRGEPPEDEQPTQAHRK